MAVVGVLGVVGMSARKVYRMARNIEQTLDLVNANVKVAADAAAGVEEIRREVKTNGGSSLKDAVHRIEARVLSLEERHSSCPHVIGGPLDSPLNHP